jgi:hypothetical protein
MRLGWGEALETARQEFDWRFSGGAFLGEVKRKGPKPLSLFDLMSTFASLAFDNQASTLWTLDYRSPAHCDGPHK